MNRVGAVLNIHAGAIGQLIEQFDGDLEAPLGVGQGQQHGIVGRMTGFGAVKGIQPRLQPLPSFIRRLFEVVGNVVAAAHEGVHRAQRLALGVGQDEESVVEILGRRAGDAAAYGICDRDLRRGRRKWRGHGLHGGAHIRLPRLPPSSFPNAARATSASLRVFEIAGRRPSTAWPWRSMAFRISCPPRLNNSISTASSRSTS